MSASDPLLGRKIRSSITLQAVLGDGGMGRVYRGFDEKLSRTVAVKLLRPEHQDIDTAKVYFEREARAASKLWHPNIIQIIDFGAEPDGTLYLVMEYIPGRNLADVLEQDFPLDADRVVRILVQLLTALEEAHQQGIVHRDLKPENIMLQDVPGNPDFVKVLDFGVAKAIGVDTAGPMTIQGLVMGTPHFMSPEQALGHDIDARSDLYSVGAILYQVLTCDLPFDGELVMNVLARVITERPVPPRQRRPNYPIDPRLERICLRAMRKSADGRFQTAGEFRGALLELVDEEAASEIVYTPATPRPAVAQNESRISQADLEPIRQRSQRAYQESMYDFMELRDADIAGKRIGAVTLAIQSRSPIGSDPRLLNRVRSAFEREVERADGFPASQVGPLATALFGYPTELDNPIENALRAARAVIESVDAEAPGIVLGVGVAMGQLVAPDGDLAASYGRPLDTALHLAASADDRQILLDESAIRVVADHGLRPSQVSGAYEIDLRSTGAVQAAVPAVQLPLLERETAVAQLQHSLRELALGKGFVVSVLGTAGTGKTRLLELIARDAEQERVSVIRTSAEAFPTAIPATVARRIAGLGLELVPADRPSEAIDSLQLSPESSATIRHLLDAGPPPNQAPFWVDVLRFALFEFLQALAKRTPLLIVVDRFDATDLLSFAVLRTLAANFGETPVGLIVAGDRSHGMTRSFAAQYPVVELPPLSATAVRGALRREFPDLPKTRIDAAVEFVGGVPGNLALLANYLVEHRSAPVPGSTIDILAEGLESLPETARKLLALGGSMGASFPYEVLASCAPRSWPLRDDLERIGRAGLLDINEDTTGSWLSFEPATLAKLSLEQLPDQVRRQLHLRVAKYYEGRRASGDANAEDAFQLARQLGASGDGLAATRLLVRAAEDALDDWGPRAALPVVDHALDALNLLQHDLSDEVFQTTALRAVSVIVRAQYFEHALTLLERFDVTAFATALRSRFYLLKADASLGIDAPTDARQAAESGLHAVPENDYLLQARLHFAHALALESSRALNGAIGEARAAREAFQKYGGRVRDADRELAWQPTLLEARIRIFLKQYADAAALLESTILGTQHDPTGIVRLQHALAFALRAQGRVADARQALADAIEATRACGDLRTRVRLLMDLSALHLDGKDRASALTELTSATALAKALGMRDAHRVAAERLRQLTR